MTKKEKINDSSFNRCPACSGSLIGDLDRGEIICPDCGYVAVDQTEDIGPEWKAIDLEDKSKRVRVGSPMTLTIHDYGLSTKIGSEMKDSSGNSVDPHMRASLNRMNKWQNRIRTSTSSERTLSKMLSRITDLCDSLNLPRNVSETAAQIYRNASRMQVAKSKSTIGIASAVVYLACRKCQVHRSLKEVATAAEIDKRSLAKYYRLVLTEVEESYVPIPLIEKHISKLVNIAKLDGWSERVAIQLATKTSDAKILSGKSPAGLAAAYLYISYMLLGEKLPQKEIAEIADATEVTVRNRCREILDNFVIKQRLNTSD